MNQRMNQDFYVKFALFVPVLVSHIQSGSSDGSSKLSRGSANYHLESALLPRSTCFLHKRSSQAASRVDLPVESGEV